MNKALRIQDVFLSVAPQEKQFLVRRPTCTTRRLKQMFWKPISNKLRDLEMQCCKLTKFTNSAEAETGHDETCKGAAEILPHVSQKPTRVRHA